MLKISLHSAYLFQEASENTPQLEKVYFVDLTPAVKYIKNTYSRFLEVLDKHSKEFSVDDMFVRLIFEYIVYYYEPKTDTVYNVLSIINNIMDEVAEYILNDEEIGDVHGFITHNLKNILSDPNLSKIVRDRLKVITIFDDPNARLDLFVMPLKWIGDGLIVAGYRRG